MTISSLRPLTPPVSIDAPFRPARISKLPPLSDSIVILPVTGLFVLSLFFILKIPAIEDEIRPPLLYTCQSMF